MPATINSRPLNEANTWNRLAFGSPPFLVFPWSDTCSLGWDISGGAPVCDGTDPMRTVKVIGNSLEVKQQTAGVTYYDGVVNTDGYAALHDWRGFGKDDILEWEGPPYHNWGGGDYFTDWGSTVYYHGQVASYAPGSINGAAFINTQYHGKWMIMVVPAAGSVKVYAKPMSYGTSGSAQAGAFAWNRDPAEDKWELVGTHAVTNYKATGDAYSSTWHFNGSGNEAQSVSWNSTSQTCRAKITITVTEDEVDPDYGSISSSYQEYSTEDGFSKEITDTRDTTYTEDSKSYCNNTVTWVDSAQQVDVDGYTITGSMTVGVDYDGDTAILIKSVYNYSNMIVDTIDYSRSGYGPADVGVPSWVWDDPPDNTVGHWECSEGSVCGCNVTDPGETTCVCTGWEDYTVTQTWSRSIAITGGETIQMVEEVGGTVRSSFDVYAHPEGNATIGGTAVETHTGPSSVSYAVTAFGASGTINDHWLYRTMANNGKFGAALLTNGLDVWNYSAGSVGAAHLYIDGYALDSGNLYSYTNSSSTTPYHYLSEPTGRVVIDDYTNATMPTINTNYLIGVHDLYGAGDYDNSSSTTVASQYLEMVDLRQYQNIKFDKNGAAIVSSRAPGGLDWFYIMEIFSASGEELKDFDACKTLFQMTGTSAFYLSPVGTPY